MPRTNFQNYFKTEVSVMNKGDITRSELKRIWDGHPTCILQQPPSGLQHRIFTLNGNITTVHLTMVSIAVQNHFVSRPFPV